MSERYPSVIITSDRPAMTGGRHRLSYGEGVILPDEPNMVYVTGINWYGLWPLDETNVACLRAEQKDREERTRILDETTLANAPIIESNLAFNRLTGALKEASPGIEHVKTSYLLTGDGKYIRLPSKDEFAKSFEDLERDGKVRR